MTRAIALVVAVTLLTGCKGNSVMPPVDPFGRTTIEPPRTGAVGIQQPPDRTFYTTPGQNGVPAAVGVPPATTGAAPVTPAGQPAYEPPDGSFQYKGSSAEAPRPLASQPGDRISIPVAARDLSAEPNPLAGGPPADSWPSPIPETPTGSEGRSGVELAGTTSRSTLAGRERIVRNIEPRSGATLDKAAGISTSAASDLPEQEPSRIPSTEGIINIMDLPAAGASHQRRVSPGSDVVRLASATEPIDGAQESGTSSPAARGQADSFSSPARYGHAPDYGWIQGRLEYSQIDRRWKLRYIPIDGRTDDFGGSVVIADAAALSGYERGEFVEVRGQIDSAAADDHDFAPEYTVQQIQRLAD